VWNLVSLTNGRT